LNNSGYADRIKILMSDETFKEVIQNVKNQQAAVFLDPSSAIEDREEAHGIVRALGKIDEHFQSVLTDEKISNRK
jgi:hypothetical protein